MIQIYKLGNLEYSKDLYMYYGIRPLEPKNIYYNCTLSDIIYKSVISDDEWNMENEHIDSMTVSDSRYDYRLIHEFKDYEEFRDYFIEYLI